jgi:hypothetical protein
MEVPRGPVAEPDNDNPPVVVEGAIYFEVAVVFRADVRLAKKTTRS